MMIPSGHLEIENRNLEIRSGSWINLERYTHRCDIIKYGIN